MRYQLEYPKSLESLWKYQHGQQVDLPESEVEVIWSQLQKTLGSAARSAHLKFHNMEPVDLAQDYIVHLLNGACPSEIRSRTIYINRARAFWSERYNPAGKEISDAIYEALRQLVKAKELERSAPGHVISHDTFFWLPSCERPVDASPEDCKSVIVGLPKVGKKSFGYQGKNKAILTPGQAKQLIFGLLQGLGGDRAVTTEVLVKCALACTRGVMSPFVESLDESVGAKGGESEDCRSKVDLLSSDGSRWDSANLIFSVLQANDLGRATAEKIWTYVLDKADDKIFCLYTLPSQMGQKNGVTLRELGTTSTVGSHHENLKKVIFREAEFLLYGNEGDYRMTDSYRAEVFSVICDNLKGRCVEKGYNMTLSKM